MDADGRGWLEVGETAGISAVWGEVFGNKTLKTQALVYPVARSDRKELPSSAIALFAK